MWREDFLGKKFLPQKVTKRHKKVLSDRFGFFVPFCDLLRLSSLILVPATPG